MESELFFSVVIPVRDRLNSFKQTITSVLNQSFRNFEIIIVENNSSESNREELRKYLNSLYGYDISIFFDSMVECCNANVARNNGFNLARGKYVAFLDSDDCWEIDYLQLSHAFLEMNDLDFSYSSAKVYDGNKSILKYARDLLPNETGVQYLFGLNKGWAQSSGFILKRKSFNSSPWNPHLKRNQDLDLFIRVTGELICKANTLTYTIINWKKGEVRSYDSHSIFQFINCHRNSLFGFPLFRYLIRNIFASISNYDFLTASRLCLLFFSKGILGK